MIEAGSFGTGQVFWSMLWFFLFFIWIWLLIVVFGDIFRSDDLVRLGQGPLDDLRDRPALSRGLRVPDRSRQQDGSSTQPRPRASKTRRPGSTSALPRAQPAAVPPRRSRA